MDEQTMVTELQTIDEVRSGTLDALISLAEEQRSILVQGRHSDLLQNVARFDPLLAELDHLENRQNALLDERGIGGRRDDTLMLKTQRLRELTEVNRELLQNAMEYVHFTMGVICRVAADACAENESAPLDRNPAIVLDARV